MGRTDANAPRDDSGLAVVHKGASDLWSRLKAWMKKVCKRLPFPRGLYTSPSSSSGEPPSPTRDQLRSLSRSPSVQLSHRFLRSVDLPPTHPTRTHRSTPHPTHSRCVYLHYTGCASKFSILGSRRRCSDCSLRAADVWLGHGCRASSPPHPRQDGTVCGRATEGVGRWVVDVWPLVCGWVAIGVWMCDDWGVGVCQLWWGWVAIGVWVCGHWGVDGWPSRFGCVAIGVWVGGGWGVCVSTMGRHITITAPLWP